jgi:hypothetical protein
MPKRKCIFGQIWILNLFGLKPGCGIRCSDFDAIKRFFLDDEFRAQELLHRDLLPVRHAEYQVNTRNRFKNPLQEWHEGNTQRIKITSSLNVISMYELVQ